MLLDIEASEYQRVRIKTDPIHWIRENRPTGNLIVGSHHITDAQNKVKYIQYDQWPVTGGEIANKYLELITEDKTIRRQQPRTTAPPPMQYVGPKRGLMVYVDIVACYFSLYRQATLDMAYTANFVGLGDVPFLWDDELALHKLTRNTVYGIMRKKGRDRYKAEVPGKGMWHRSNERGPWYAPGLIAYVMDTIQAVAQDCVAKFPIYSWLTDAAIIDYKAAGELIEYLADEWQLRARRVVSGQGFVYNLGRYWIDGKKGGSDLARLTPQASDNFVPVNIDRLKEIRRELCASR